MEQVNLQGALIPYLFYELLDRLGGSADFNASKMLEMINSEEDRGVAMSIAHGILLVKLIDKDDIDADES